VSCGVIVLSEHGLQLLQHDSDFDLMAKHIGHDII